MTNVHSTWETQATMMMTTTHECTTMKWREGRLLVGKVESETQVQGWEEQNLSSNEIKATHKRSKATSRDVQTTHSWAKTTILPDMQIDSSAKTTVLPQSYSRLTVRQKPRYYHTHTDDSQYGKRNYITTVVLTRQRHKSNNLHEYQISKLLERDVWHWRPSQPQRS